MSGRTYSLAAAAMVLSGLASLNGQVTSTGPQARAVTTATLPPSKTVVAVLRDAGHFMILLQMVDAAGMRTQLEGAGPFTIFAPTDDAFGRVPQGRRDTLLRDKAAVEILVKNHVIGGRLTAAEMRQGARGRRFLGGAALRVDMSGPSPRVNGAQLLKGDLTASNGVVHAIDQVWLPQAARAPRPPS